MKKLFLLLCAVTLSVFSKAQGLGDYMEIDSVPGFVFYVDESGEHGLVMSFPELPEKWAKAYWVKRGFMTEENLKKIITPSKREKNGKKISWKELEVYYKELIPFLSDDGEQNSLVINKFCEEKSIELSLFPGQPFAAKLGKGWFVPGDRELKLFADFFSGGLEKANSYMPVKRAKELSNDMAVQTTLLILTGGSFSIGSSTMKFASSGFRVLNAKAISKKLWLRLLDEYNNRPAQLVLRTCFVAIHKF